MIVFSLLSSSTLLGHSFLSPLPPSLPFSHFPISPPTATLPPSYRSLSPSPPSLPPSSLPSPLSSPPLPTDHRHISHLLHPHDPLSRQPKPELHQHTPYAGHPRLQLQHPSRTINTRLPHYRLSLPCTVCSVPAVTELLQHGHIQHLHSFTHRLGKHFLGDSKVHELTQFTLKFSSCSF